jgi:hypothetical protein
MFKASFLFTAPYRGTAARHRVLSLEKACNVPNVRSAELLNNATGSASFEGGRQQATGKYLPI